MSAISSMPRVTIGASAPIDGCGHPAVEDTDQRVVAHVFLGRNIRNGRVDQLDDEMAFVDFGMQRSGVIPVKLLGGGWTVIAIAAAKPLGADAQKDRPTKDGEVA